MLYLDHPLLGKGYSREGQSAADKDHINILVNDLWRAILVLLTQVDVVKKFAPRRKFLGGEGYAGNVSAW